MRDPTFLTDGAQRFRCALSNSDVLDVLAALDAMPTDQAGVRITDAAGLAKHLQGSGALGRIASDVIGSGAFPVRAVLFDKTPERNWALGWHQDRTIVVRRRVETPGYGPWSTKASMQHVAPPFSVLAGMATLRLHLDPVGPDNAPLLIASGSHRLGSLNIEAIPGVVRDLGSFACLAEVGDVWAYATPILHASDTASRPLRRRVLQVDYAARPLDGDLEWLGLAQACR